MHDKIIHVINCEQTKDRTKAWQCSSLVIETGNRRSDNFIKWDCENYGSPGGLQWGINSATTGENSLEALPAI